MLPLQVSMYGLTKQFRSLIHCVHVAGIALSMTVVCSVHDALRPLIILTTT